MLGVTGRGDAGWPEPKPVEACLAGMISPPVALVAPAARRHGRGGESRRRWRRPARCRPPASGRRSAALLAGRDAGLDRLAAEIGPHRQRPHRDGWPVRHRRPSSTRRWRTRRRPGSRCIRSGDPRHTRRGHGRDRGPGWMRRACCRPDAGGGWMWGCGIGRVAAALAPPLRPGCWGWMCRAGMVAEARRRHAGVPGLGFPRVTDGRGLPNGPGSTWSCWSTACPTSTRPGWADNDRGRPAAQALRPGGSLVVLNLSYGREPADDRADAERWAAAHGWDRLGRPSRSGCGMRAASSCAP